MFKVHEKFNDREVWVRLSEIMQVYRTDDDDYTVLMFQNGVHLNVTESVDKILMAIHTSKTRPRLLHSEV